MSTPVAAPEIWGNVADWVVAVTALVGVVIATRQLVALRRAEEQSANAHEQLVEIERANMLRQIDAEFESGEMYRTRKAVRALRNRAERVVRRSHGDASEERIAELSALEFSKQLTTLWHKAKAINDEDVEAPESPDRIAADRYAELMHLPNWLETLGYMVRRGLLPRDDILEIYDGAIVPAMVYFAEHIKKRRDEGPYPNRNFLEHATWLCGETQRFMKEKNAPAPIDSGQHRSPWR